MVLYDFLLLAIHIPCSGKRKKLNEEITKKTKILKGRQPVDTETISQVGLYKRRRQERLLDPHC